MIASTSMQTFHRLPSLSIRVYPFVLALIASVTSVSALASEATRKPVPPAAAHRSAETQVLLDSSIDISEKYSPTKIKFGPCAEDPSLDCGMLNVPVDYRHPHGETVSIAVIRAKATNPDKRIGVLMMNNGGPGQSGVDFVRTGVRVPAFILVRERFDIVSFDVRGSHRSRPVRCEVEPSDVPTDLDDAALRSFFDDFSRRVANACLEQNGPFITSMSTNNIARDMDVLRRALGESQVTYIGLSFGTELGAVYASLFPQRVRAMVLDSSVAPEFRDSLVEFWSEHSAAFEVAFRHLDQLCRRDLACRLNATGVVPAFEAVSAKLKTEPVTSEEGAVLTDAEVRNVVGELLYSERFWPLAVDALADALAGNYSLLFQLIPSFSPKGQDGVPLALETTVFTAHTAILCNDFGTRRPATEYLPVDEAVGALQTNLYGRFFVASGVGRCAAWPKGDPPIIKNVKGHVATPILLIGTDFDNASPLIWTRRLARALGMDQSVIRYQGGGHAAATSGSPCIAVAVAAYLFNLTMPSEGFTCPAQPISFAPPEAQANSKRVISNHELDLLRSRSVLK
jgi:pimeloyl-ACP methyl ester carboxylesterase